MVDHAAASRPQKKPDSPSVPKRRPMADEAEFRAWLRAYCETLTFKEVARKHKMSPSQLSNLVAGRLSIGPKTARRFGFERIDTVAFVPIDREKS